MSKQKIMVTSALPYANGQIHLGHIAGAYLPADIYVRFHRLMGTDIVFICGTDEHGVPITLRAEAEGVTPRTIVKRYHEDIKKAFERMNIVFDNFSGTSNMHNKYHATLSREFFINLLHNKLVDSHLSDQFYCKQCERFLPDRFVQGICPKCGYTEARGDECSQCHSQYDPLELKEAKCKICSQVPGIKATKHWYLRLDILQKELEGWINTKTYWKENVLHFVQGWLKQGLKERAITRDLYWGVPVPLEEAAGKVLYVWFDAPIGYISSTMEWAQRQGSLEKWKEYWQNPDCRIVHFIGKDNIPFHAIIWPGMLLGQRKGYELPYEIPANEYLNFGIAGDEKSDKASKSTGNVVWAHEALDSFPADMLRYYLAAYAPEKTDVVFTWRDFQKRCNSELLGIIGNLANRVLKFLENNFGSKVPPAGKMNSTDTEVGKAIGETIEKVRNSFEKFEVRSAIAEIVSLARTGNQYFDEKAPWNTIRENKEDCQTCLWVSTQLIHTIAMLLSPVVPDFSIELWKQLGHKDKITQWSDAGREVPAGHTIGTPKAIVSKVEDDIIASLEEKLAKAIEGKTKSPPAATGAEAKVSKEEKAKEHTSEEKVKDAKEEKARDAKNEKTGVPPPVLHFAQDGGKPLKENLVSLDTFATLDIRMGEIVEAQSIPKANKLLRLTIQIGSETRQVVAGIAESYKPEELKGRKVPVLTNLQPAKIKGIESQGMILCADANGRPVLLSPVQDVPSGSVVR
jgi:methionyl-tRNA synthetase